MCATASVQVCVDAGHEEPGPLGYGRRWLLAHLLGAVLAAAFANSPTSEGCPTGYRTTRQVVWSQLDPDRTLAPPAGAGSAHRLGALRPGRTGDVHPLRGRPLGRSGGAHLPRVDPVPACPRPPTQEDLDYHVTTLFPPVRPRGHLELRMIDAQSGDAGWIVPLAVTAALFDDPEAHGAGVPHRQTPGGDGRFPPRAAQSAVAARRPRRADRPGAARRRGGLFRRRAGGTAAPRRLPRGARGGRGVHRTLCGTRPLPRGRPSRRPVRRGGRSHRWEGRQPVTIDPELLRERAASALLAARDRTRLLTTCVERSRPRRPALPADVPAGLGPGAHRQPGGAVAAAHRRRP